MLSALKNFGVTFLIAALLFGVIAYFATNFVTGTVKDILEEEKAELDDIIQAGDTETTPPDEEVIPLPGTEEEKIPEGESFNFLLLTTDYRPDIYDTYRPTLDTMYNTDWGTVDAGDTTGCLSGDYRTLNLSTITMVRIDKEKRQVIYSYFSPETRVYTSTGYHTLSEVYTLYGKQRVADYINAMTGLQFRYIALLNGYNMDELFDLMDGVLLNVPRDLYHDGKYPTMQYETTIERVGDDGEPWTEHIPNTWLQSAGEQQVRGNSFYNLLSVVERSAADLSAKTAYTIELTQKLLGQVAALEENDRKVLLAKLITREAEWDKIMASLVDESGETLIAPETVVETAAPETEVPAETEPVDFEPADRWTSELFEPDTPILETSYTMNEFDDVNELLEAISYFEPVVVTYPYTYKAATEDEEAYFEANTAAGLGLYMSYRLIGTADEDAQS